MALKRKSMFGLEVEFMTVDEQGRLVHKADSLIERFKGKKLGKKVIPEVSPCMVEMTLVAKRSIRESALSFIDDLRVLLETGEKAGIRLLPLGTHPSRAKIKTRSNKWYEAKKAVVGKENFAPKAGKVCGFHFHHTLPEGIVSRETQGIRTVKRSRAKDIFLHQYNFMIAADPAAITLCQSSPFWYGVHYGSDCRVFAYRDLKTTKKGEALRGLHYHLPVFGALPRYELTLQDVRVFADQRKREWLRTLEKIDFPTTQVAVIPSLKFVWGPLRVNKIGTLEYRGPDMNHPDVIFSVSSLLRFALTAIEEMGLVVVPSDIGSTEPFAFEDNIVYVPPYTTLRQLEYQSAKGGLGIQEIRRYCNRLYNFTVKVSGKNSKNLERVKEILKKERTVSDDILEMVRKNGNDPDEEIPEDLLNHIALYHADKLSKSLDGLEKQFGSFAD